MIEQTNSTLQIFKQLEEDAKYKMAEDESVDEYELRLCSYKQPDKLTWDMVATLANKQLGTNYTESKYRRLWKIYNLGKMSVVNSQLSEENSEFDDLLVQKIELKKAKVKLSDERIQTNAYIRLAAREETIKEIAEDFADKMTAKKILQFRSSPVIVNDNAKEAILLISDWHYGMEFTNYWNSYSQEIAKARVGELLEKTLALCKSNNIKRIHIVNLADLIAGRIHLQLRVESRIDTITQIMEVSEILAEFLNTLSQKYDVHYYDCLDNHSRLEPNKKESIDLESLSRLTPWYLKTRLKDSVVIHDNIYGPDIISLQCKGYTALGVHGHQDKPSQVIDNLSMLTQQHYDLILSAHLHHFSADEKNETIFISNGSLMGTDSFAKNLRLSSKPSQTLVVVSNDSPCECIYRIILTK